MLPWMRFIRIENPEWRRSFLENVPENRKIVEEVRNSKTETYELKLEPPKLWLMDYIWLFRVIDHRIAGGAASKMIKELIKYPIKTSKMEIVVRTQNKRKISQLTEESIVSYL